MDRKRMIKITFRFSGITKFKLLSCNLLISRNTLREQFFEVVSKLISVCRELEKLYVRVVAL